MTLVESVTLNIHIARYAPDTEGVPLYTDSASVTIDRADCISSADYIKDIVKVFTDRGARFDATGSDFAQAECYQDPYTGEFSVGTISFADDYDTDLVNMVMTLADSGLYR